MSKCFFLVLFFSVFINMITYRIIIFNICFIFCNMIACNPFWRVLFLLFKIYPLLFLCLFGLLCILYIKFFFLPLTLLFIPFYVFLFFFISLFAYSILIIYIFPYDKYSLFWLFYLYIFFLINYTNYSSFYLVNE